MEAPETDIETFETIPWSQLAPAQAPLATRIGIGIVGVLVGAVLAFLLVSLLRDEPTQTVVALPEAGVATPELVSPVGQVTTPSLQSVQPPELATLYTEADLMAVIPEEEQRVAAARAEWFVTDFFTVDGDLETVRSVRAALPGGIDVSLPHDDAQGVSYVEWSRATAVRPDGSGRYAVDVAFRILAGAGDGALSRRPVRAVRVRVQITESATATILDLPEPIALEVGASADFAAPAPAAPTAEIAAAAGLLVAPIGEADEILAAGVDASGWRIVIAVRDPSGLRWPLTVRP